MKVYQREFPKTGIIKSQPRIKRLVNVTIYNMYNMCIDIISLMFIYRNTKTSSAVSLYTYPENISFYTKPLPMYTHEIIQN